MFCYGAFKLTVLITTLNGENFQGTCVNRLFEGIEASDSEDEDFIVQRNWADPVDDETDSEVEFIFADDEHVDLN